MHKNNKHQNQSSSLKGWQGNGLREGYMGELDCFCEVLFIKLSGNYRGAITKKNHYMELTVVPKLKISTVREQVTV